MVPTLFTEIFYVPLTANGKIDRKKLLEISETSTLVKSDELQPRDRLEYELCNLWREILKTNALSINDDFRSLGGHSLLAIMLISKINQKFGFNFPVSWPFTNNTVSKHANILRNNAISMDQKSLILKFNEDGEKPPLFFVHPGGGGAEAYFSLASQFDSDQPFYGIDSYHLNSDDSCVENLEKLASHYIEHIRFVRPRGPYYLGGWSFGGLIAFEINRQLIEQGEQIENLYLLDACMFDKETIGLLRNIPLDEICNILDKHDLYHKSLPAYYKNRYITALESEKKFIMNYEAEIKIKNAMLFKAMTVPRKEENLLYQIDPYFEMWNAFSRKQDNGWGVNISNLDIIPINSIHHDLLSEKNIELIARSIQEDINRR